MLRFGLALCGALCLAAPAGAATYRVSPAGSDTANGVTSPFRTLAKAASVLSAGDTIVLSAGTYTAGVWIGGSNVTIRGEGEVILDGAQGTRDDGLRADGVNGLTVENVTIRRCRSKGIFMTRGSGLTVRNCVITDNPSSGILTGNVHNVLIENTVAARNGSHGIYLSQSGDKLTVRRCTLFSNGRAGLQINAVQESPSAGDPSNDSHSDNCLVECNTAYQNGSVGGAAYQFMGVRNSTIVNNLAYRNLSGGITLYDDGAGAAYACKNNRILHNTIVFATGVGRYGLQVVPGSTGNEVYNNIFVCGNGPAIETSEPIKSNYNCLWGQGTVNGGSLAQWRSATGNDQNSGEGDPKLTSDFHLAAGSPAIDGAASIHGTDKDGALRPQGANPDIGCYEMGGTSGGNTGGGDTGGGDTGGGDTGGGSTPPPGGGTAIVVYGDALVSGWNARAKGANLDLSVSAPVQQGSSAMSLVVNRRDGGFQIGGQGLAVDGKSVLKLSIHGGKKGGQNVRVRAIVNGVDESFSLNLRNYGGLPQKNGWIELSIPLSQLKQRSGSITGLVFFSGTAMKKAYLDHIRFE
jgi:parallel beta-helix repeat protein